MKKLFVIIALLFSYTLASDYSDGFKLYKQAKKALRKDKISSANNLFLQAKIKFESASKNNTQALIKLAELYCNGWGVTQDKIQAENYLNKAKKLGVSFISSKCLKNLN
jgi:TPR repeat protein